jgi:hypothetical protein
MSIIIKEKYENIMREREKTKKICFGNTTIESSLGIFNYPKGFQRKDIFTSCILSKNEDIDHHNDYFEFNILEDYYTIGQIRKYKVIKSKKTNTQIIVCHEYEIDSWKATLERANVNFVVYDKKKSINFDFNNKQLNVTILCSSLTISRFIQIHFQSYCAFRLILCDPELYIVSDSLPRIFYNYCWIMTSDTHFLLTLKKNHFVFKFLPFNIDFSIYNSLSIIKDLRIQEELKKIYNLPNFHLVKHTHRASLHNILKGYLDPEIYDDMEKGNFSSILQKLNMNEDHNNIYYLLNNQLTSEISVIDNFLKNVKLNKNTQHDIVSQHLQKKEKLEEQKQKLTETLNNFCETNVCMICNDNLHDKEIALVTCCYNCCSCMNCVFKWLEEHKECPYCRQVIFFDNIYSLQAKSIVSKTIDTSNNAVSYHNELKTKQNTLFDLISKYISESSIMVYCETEEYLKNIEEFCRKKNISLFDFQGSYGEKKEMISNKQKHSVYFISDYKELIGFAFSTSINHFISYSFLDKTIYKYICSRFYRIGRKNDFFYHYFLSYTEDLIHNR